MNAEKNNTSEKDSKPSASRAEKIFRTVAVLGVTVGSGLIGHAIDRYETGQHARDQITTENNANGYHDAYLDKIADANRPEYVWLEGGAEGFTAVSLGLLMWEQADEARDRANQQQPAQHTDTIS